MEENISQTQPVGVGTKPVKNWLKIVLFSVLGLVLAGGLVWAGYWYGVKSEELKAKSEKLQVKTQNLTPTPIPLVTSLPTFSPEATPSLDETAEWKSYTNTEYGYSIKYPVNWQVEKDVNYIGPDSPNYTFFFKEKVEFMPGVSVYVVPKTTPEKWLGADLAHGMKEQIIVGRTQGLAVLNAPGVSEQEWVFVDKTDQTIIFYASGGKDELAVFNLMLSTFRFLE